MKKIRKETRKKWQELVSEYERRKINCYEFCKINKISRASIYKWSKYFKQEAISNINIEEEGGFIPLRIESEVGNKTEAYCNKQEESLGKYKEQVNESQFSKITSPIRISKNCGLTIEFASGCTASELDKIIEVMNVTK